jgi:hypothetical protein
MIPRLNVPISAGSFQSALKLETFPLTPPTANAVGSSNSPVNSIDDGADMSGPRWRLSRAGTE